MFNTFQINLIIFRTIFLFYFTLLTLLLDFLLRIYLCRQII
jgi:hypothetical protein